MSVLSFNQVEKTAGNQVVFPRFDLHIQAGRVTAVQCVHEAGRQLIGMVTGTCPVSHGEVRFGDVSINGRARELASRFGAFLLDDALYERLTPIEYLQLFKNLHSSSASIDSLIRQVGLSNLARKRISKLTYSEKRRVQMARMLVHGPELLLLEEPEQNLDIESRIILQRVLTEFAEAGGAVMLTTSNLENAVTMGDVVYRLDRDGLKLFETVEEEIPLEEPVVDLIQEEEIMSKDESDGNDPAEESVETDSPTSIQIRFDKIPAKVNEKLILFDPTEIVFVESIEGVSQLHVNGETFPCAIKMADLDRARERLPVHM